MPGNLPRITRAGAAIAADAPSYAIVLGAAVWPEGQPSPTLRRRAAAAAALYHAGAVVKIIASGGFGRHPPSEADVIRDVLIGLGVPESAVICEERSTTTRENLGFSKALLPKGASAVIVTDGWHLPRARLIARRLGLAATGVRAPLRGTTLHGTAKAIFREIAALIWEILRPLS